LLFTSPLFLAFFGLISILFMLFNIHRSLGLTRIEDDTGSTPMSNISDYFKAIAMSIFKLIKAAYYKLLIRLKIGIGREKDKSTESSLAGNASTYNKGLKLGNKKYKNNLNNALLLFSSLLFYITLNKIFILILLSVVTWDYYLGKLIETSSHRKKLFLLTSICLNIGTLLLFKYAHFMSINILNIIIKVTEINQLNDYNNSIESIEWVLPLGISFFIFQSMSYTIDLYRGIIKPSKSWMDYCLYVSFFPQLVAGPIVKAKEFLPQLYDRITWSQVPLFSAFSWIALGFFKKAVLADRLAEIVDFAYGNVSALDWSFALISILSYSFQIFLDFSGYSDIAIGIAFLFGFRLSKNFNLPYLSKSFSEFWNRWHISLSSWLKDYLYIPLGGNRIGSLLTYRNLFLVMLLGGLWHGASWNFVIWGGLHGCLLALERLFFDKKITITENLKESSFGKFKSIFIYKLFPTLLVFSLTTLLWVLFRAPDFSTAIEMFLKVFTLDSGLKLPYTFLTSFSLVFLFLSVGHIAGKCKIHPEYWDNSPFKIKHGLAFAIIAIAITLLARPGKPFIYFVF
jgi:alginate O-acetyltransferase complex protein AlgI